MKQVKLLQNNLQYTFLIKKIELILCSIPYKSFAQTLENFNLILHLPWVDLQLPITVINTVPAGLSAPVTQTDLNISTLRHNDVIHANNNWWYL